MGNCLVLKDKGLWKIKSTDTDILKYHSTSRICQADKQRGHLYHLHQPKKIQIKENSAVRIKMVISKQELKEILEREGLTFEDMMSQIQKEPGYSRKKRNEKSVTWKPDLESVSEANDL
ncbi:uncharacterized protein A4U43_C09F520 [Asparagus officinalis]|uniref:Uncharacterized protein n=1 Tax=Asparagus officinalis TaxID=4686 RepID=A0A5P1E4I6_ASPOF|nr:uncharacterized protein A4U43_C09F520 [Asparagus officinalis]